jgi:hypothetical protein
MIRQWMDALVEPFLHLENRKSVFSFSCHRAQHRLAMLNMMHIIATLLQGINVRYE